ncbi:MAG: RIP metalloprotease RseP [Candidatus Cloacimonetes bacterium]|nr:RIP metalloprotease RseP [Candidatus Cloacimonadota bacterium]
MTLINILIFAGALGVLVTVHEFGHLIVAKLFGIYVEKFSIGFGPKIFSYQGKTTEYRLSLLPLGGYVKMKGENADEKKPDEDSFSQKPWWKRALVTFGGPFFNLILGFLLFALMYGLGKTYEDQYPVIAEADSLYASYFRVGDEIVTVNGKSVYGFNQITELLHKDKENTFVIERNLRKETIQTGGITPEKWITFLRPEIPPKVGEVSPGMPAFRAGLKEGDLILMVDGTPVQKWTEMRRAIINSDKSELEFVIERDGTQLTKTINREENVLSNGQKMIGISQFMPVKYKERYSVGKCFVNSGYMTANFIVANYTAFYYLIKNPEMLKSSVGGPVMMYSMSKQSTGKGLDTLIGFIAALSLILMIMNLLPIPILDGGQIFFYILEGIFGKPLPIKAQMLLQQIGLIILLTLMVFAFYSDFSQMFYRNKSIRSDVLRQEQMPLELKE